MSAPTQPKTDPSRGWLAELGPWWQRSKAQMRRSPVATALSLLVVLGGLGFVAYYFGYRDYAARQQLRLAEAALEIDDFETAIRELRACLEARPEHAEAHFLLARTLRRAERFTDVDDHLVKAERLGWSTDQIAVELMLAGVQTRGPTNEEQRVLYERLQTRSPDEPIMLEALVIAYFRLHRMDYAYHWLMHWVTNYPDDWRAYLRRGDYYYVAGVIPKAREDFEAVYRLRPDHPMIRRLLGLSYLKLSTNLDQAVEHLRAHTQDHPHDAEALDALARCQRLLGQQDAARATLDKLLRRQRNFAGAYLTLAQIEVDLNHPEFALEALQQFRQRPAANVEDAHTAATLGAKLLRQLNRTDEARVAEERVERFKTELETLLASLEKVRKGDRDPNLGRQIGRIYLWMGLEAEGRGWLQTVLKDNPNDEGVRRILEEHAGRKEPPPAPTK